MTTISAEVIADSMSPNESRLTTLQLRYPRWIHAEGRTHRVIKIGEQEPDQVDPDFSTVLGNTLNLFASVIKSGESWTPQCQGMMDAAKRALNLISDREMRTPSLMEDENLSRNASSSRAVPVKRLILDVLRHPAIPIYWGKNQKGMQAGDENDTMVPYPHAIGVSPPLLHKAEAWLRARDAAIDWARSFDEAGYAKQIVNRLLEPFSHINVVVSATRWNNFFALRDHKDAEPHIRDLARAIKRAMAASTPKELKPGEWHLPYVGFTAPASWDDPEHVWQALRCSVARCARVSYLTYDGRPPLTEEDLGLYDKLAVAMPLHASPAEHQATVKRPGSRIWVTRRHQDVLGAGTKVGGVVQPVCILENDESSRFITDVAGNFGDDWVQFRKLLPYENLESLEPAPELPDA